MWFEQKAGWLTGAQGQNPDLECKVQKESLKVRKQERKKEKTALTEVGIYPAAAWATS